MLWTGSLQNNEDDAEDNVDLKNEFVFYLRISRYKSFTLFMIVKNIANINPEHSDKFETKNYKIIAVVVHVLQTTQNLVISRRCFAVESKEMNQEL